MQKGLKIKNLKFFTGMQDYEEPNSVPPDKFYSCANARFEGKVVSSKKGFQKLGEAGTGGTSINGIYSYPYFEAGATEQRLIRFHNLSFAVYTDATAAWTAIATVWPGISDGYTDGLLYNNVMYFVNPMDSDVDGIGKITDGTFSVVPATPRGFALEAWVERIWVIGDEDAPNAIIASRAASVDHPEYIEDFDTTDGALIELIGKGGRCTAIRNLNNNFYAFKLDSIWYNTPDRFANGDTQFIELSRTGGAINQKSTIIVENDVWFVTQSLEVRSLGAEKNYLTQDPRTKNLTEVIRRTIKTLNMEIGGQDPVMSYHNRVVRIHLKTRDSATNNITIIFDYNTGGWSVDRGQAVRCNTVWANRLVYGEDGISGQVFVDDTGYSADGAKIPFQAITPFMDNDRPDLYERARYIYFRGKQSFEQALTLRLYRGNYETFSDYTIDSPEDRGIIGSVTPDGQFGTAQQGNALWGGDAESENGITLYRTEQKISVERASNMYALAVLADIDNGQVVCEQLILETIPMPESYKRSDI